MDVMEILSMEMPVPSTGWTENHVLPEECIFDLHGCLGLEYNNNEDDRTGGSSPSTDVSNDNVGNWIDEMQDFPSNPGSVDGIDDILDSSIVNEVFNYIPFLDDLGLDANLNNECMPKSQPVYEEPPVSAEIFPSGRRKQRIVPRISQPVEPEVLAEEPNINTVYVTSLSTSPYPQGNVIDQVNMNVDDPNNNIYGEKSSYIISDKNDGKLISPSWKVKEDVSKPKRKRGLSNVEKRDRKRESNRNASYRYRQKKKEMLESFKNYSDTVNADYADAKSDYFRACEELLRYIKHANLIYAVKDGGKLLM